MEVKYSFSILSLDRLLEILEKRHETHMRNDQCKARHNAQCSHKLHWYPISGSFRLDGGSFRLGSGQNFLPDLWQFGRVDFSDQVHHKAQAASVGEPGGPLLPLGLLHLGGPSVPRTRRVNSYNVVLVGAEMKFNTATAVCQKADSVTCASHVGDVVPDIGITVKLVLQLPW